MAQVWGDCGNGCWPYRLVNGPRYAVLFHTLGFCRYNSSADSVASPSKRLGVRRARVCCPAARAFRDFAVGRGAEFLPSIEGLAAAGTPD